MIVEKMITGDEQQVLDQFVFFTKYDNDEEPLV